jgi:hypothetical protein
MTPTSTEHDDTADDSPLPLLNQMVYCSRAAAGVDDAAVDRIVETSRRRNPERGITGLLVFGSGLFFQWIEGPPDAMRALLERIRADPRHSDFVPLSQTEEVRERLFPAWDMERVSSAELRDVLLDARGTVTDVRNADALARMLQHLDSGPLSTLGKV